MRNTECEMRGLFVRWLLVPAWMGLLFVLSAQPNQPGQPSLIYIDVNDKVLHFVAYAILGALLWWGLASEMSDMRRIALAVAIAAAYGITDEFHQLYVPGRHCDALDLLTDAFGAAFAACVCYMTALRVGRTLNLERGDHIYGRTRRGEDLRSQGQEASEPGRES